MNLNIQLTKQQQQYVALAVLIIGGGGYSYVKYFWMPTSKKIAETQQEVEKYERKINKAKGQAGRLNKIKKEIERLDQEALEAEKRLPKEQDLPGVIDTVSDLSRRYNVVLESFSPGRPSTKPHFIEVSYDVSMRAAYHDAGLFLAAIALEERIFNVRGVKYGSPDAAGRLTVQFQLVSYQYKG
ncbi:MAG: type 4a pilus biogenesis protein PilO [Elusimicrobiota bacterium]